MKWDRILLAAAGLALAAGCETYLPGSSSRMSEAARAREDALMMQEDLRVLKGRVEQLAADMDYLQKDAAQGGRNSLRELDERVSGVRGQLASLEQRLQNLEVARQRDKQEIIDKLTDKITQIMQKSAPRPVASTTKKQSSSTSDYGYEHVVQPGETLSQIAKAYGATLAAIVEANNLDRPDQLRAGQKLFIPE